MGVLVVRYDATQPSSFWLGALGTGLTTWEARRALCFQDHIVGDRRRFTRAHVGSPLPIIMGYFQNIRGCFRVRCIILGYPGSATFSLQKARVSCGQPFIKPYLVFNWGGGYMVGDSLGSHDRILTCR